MYLKTPSFILLAVILFSALPAQVKTVETTAVRASKPTPTTTVPQAKAKKAPLNPKKPTAAWKPITPEGYTVITWAKADGIASFFKAPASGGFIDYLTFIHLPENSVQFISSSTARMDLGPGNYPLDDANSRNWAFGKMVTERAKAENSKAKFIWDFPFHNITLSVTDLSLGLKSKDSKGKYITSGSRPLGDITDERRMLIINNKKGMAKILDFDAEIFKTEGEQAVEGFSTNVYPGGASSTARLFLGVTRGGKELVVYCSRSATVKEASQALLTAGVPEENQMQGDGGNSTACAYNLPGQYFVEPGRTLPHLMGAFSKASK